jgi:hypothetical protein
MAKVDNDVHSPDVQLKPLGCTVRREIDEMQIQRIVCLLFGTRTLTAGILRLYSDKIEILNFKSNVELNLSEAAS